MSSQKKTLEQRRIEAKRLVEQHDGNISAAANASGIPRRTLSHRYNAQLKVEAIDAKTEAEIAEMEQLEVVEKGGDEVVLNYKGANLKSAEDVVKYANVDLEKFDIIRIEVTPWQVSGKINRGQKIVTLDTPRGKKDVPVWLPQQLWKEDLLRIKVVVERAQDAYTKERREDFLELVRTEMPSFNVLNLKEGNHLCRLHIPDIHIGKVGFRESWTLEDIEHRVMETIDILLQRAMMFNLGAVSLPLGHDLFHVDKEHMSRSGTTHTTGSGTPIERLYHAGDAFVRGSAFAQRICRHIMNRTKVPLYINMVPGNHDEDSVVHLGEVLRAAFHNTSQATVNNDTYEEHEFGDTMFGKTFSWGKCAFLDTHGHTCKFEDLPLAAAQAYKGLWGEAKWFEICTGHKHISKHKPVNARSNERGTMIHISPSLSPQDSWHRKYQYHGLPGAECFVYDKETGPCGHFEKFYL